MLQQLPNAGRMVALATVTTLVVFGGLVAGITLNLRGRLRDEVLQRQADAIHSVALMEIESAARRGTAESAGVDDVFAAVLRSKKLRGVFAVQLFDATGALREALPLKPQESPAPDWPVPLEEPLARFDPHGVLETAYGLPPEPGAEVTRAPLLEIFVPLPAPQRGAPPAGVARYWIDGAPVAAEFSRLDGSLIRQGGIAFVGGALVIALVLAWAFARLAEANRRLVAQSADLARANQELDFAARTGAIGAITAHLIHGLKNPLSGLEGFVAEHAPDTNDPFRGEAWRTAADTTRRLRTMVNEVVTVLRDEAGGAADYRVPVAEMVDGLKPRVLPAAEAAGVELATEVAAAKDAAVIARIANFTALVLTNLIHNAIEAAPRGSRVRLVARAADGNVEFLIEDSGPGIPAEMRATLFRPVRSAKPGGGGIGLAISYQLARHAGGELALERSDAMGTVFRLRVPSA